MGYKTIINCQELTITGISYLGRTNPYVSVTTDGNKIFLAEVHSLLGRFDWRPKDAKPILDIFLDISRNPLVTQALEMVGDERQAACIKAFESIGLTAEDFRAFDRTENELLYPAMETNTSLDRMNQTDYFISRGLNSWGTRR